MRADAYRLLVVSVVHATPALEQHHFSGITDLAAEPGLCVRVEPRGERPWLALFNRGYESHAVLTDLLAHPADDVFCAVVGGQAYFVNAFDPSVWQALMSPFPIRAARVAHRRLYLVDDTVIASYDKHGRAWVTAELADDGIRLDDISEAEIRGAGWSSSRQEFIPFLVDTRTGHRVSGEG